MLPFLKLVWSCHCSCSHFHLNINLTEGCIKTQKNLLTILQIDESGFYLAINPEIKFHTRKRLSHFSQYPQKSKLLRKEEWVSHQGLGIELRAAKNVWGCFGFPFWSWTAGMFFCSHWEPLRHKVFLRPFLRRGREGNSEPVLKWTGTESPPLERKGKWKLFIVVGLFVVFGSNCYQIHNIFLTSDIFFLLSKDQTNHYDVHVFFWAYPFLIFVVNWQLSLNDKSLIINWTHKSTLTQTFRNILHFNGRFTAKTSRSLIDCT